MPIITHNFTVPFWTKILKSAIVTCNFVATFLAKKVWARLYQFHLEGENLTDARSKNYVNLNIFNRILFLIHNFKSNLEVFVKVSDFNCSLPCEGKIKNSDEVFINTR